MANIRRVLTGSALAAVAVAAPLVTASPASADHVGTIAGVEARCNSSVYQLCLYFNSGMNTAYWGTNSSGNIGGATFFSGTGAGSGQGVKNNAAAISCDAISSDICEVYFNSNFGGASDYAWGQSSGRLVDTYNENASVKIY